MASFFFSRTVVRLSIGLLSAILPISCIAPATPFEELASGDVSHLASGVIFPKKLGAFQRGDLDLFDTAGLDVSVAYTRIHLVDQLSATIFVYPAISTSAHDPDGNVPREMRRKLLGKSFERVKRDLLKYHPKAKLVREDHSVVMFQNQERDSLSANFEYPQKYGIFNVDMFTMASLIAVDHWLILFRLTATDHSAERSTAEMSEYVRTFFERNGGRLFKPGYGDD
jgi:hypothetical protein